MPDFIWTRDDSRCAEPHSDAGVTRQGDELTFGSARKLGPIPSGDYELEPGSGQILVSVPIEEGEPAEPILVDG